MLNRNASVYEKRFFIILIFHNWWEKTFPGAKVRLLHPAAIAPTLNAVRSGSTAVDPTEVLQAVGEVIMDGVYSAGEAKEKLLSATRENELFTNKSTKNNENTRKQT